MPVSSTISPSVGTTNLSVAKLQKAPESPSGIRGCAPLVSGVGSWTFASSPAGRCQHSWNTWDSNSRPWAEWNSKTSKKLVHQYSWHCFCFMMGKGICFRSLSEIVLCNTDVTVTMRGGVQEGCLACYTYNHKKEPPRKM